MSPSYIEIPISTNPDVDFDQFVAHMQEAFPGWEAAEGNLETWLARWWSMAKVDLAELAADVPVEIFRKFGQEVIGIPPLAAASASGQTTWTMADSKGYLVPARTAVTIPVSGNESFDFETLEDFRVPKGQTTHAGVAIVSIVPGAEPNGLTADPELVLAITGVDSIALDGETSGGVDAEDPNTYLDRLVGELRLLAPRPILPPDVATLARRVPGVARALALDGYDPATDTYDHERTVSVALMDAQGEPVTAGVKADVETMLEAMREINFVFNAIDPTMTADNEIKVSTTVRAYPAQGTLDAAGLASMIQGELAGYLSAFRWGRSPIDNDVGIWIDQTTIRRFDLVALVDSIEGVNYVETLTLGRMTGALSTADVTLEGPAGVPSPGTITVTVNPG